MNRKRRQGRGYQQQLSIFPLTAQIFCSSPDDTERQFPTPSQAERKTLLQVGYQAHSLQISGQKSEMTIKHGSNREQPSPTSKFRAWGLRWRASLELETLVCTISRRTAAGTSATAPELSRFETCWQAERQRGVLEKGTWRRIWRELVSAMCKEVYFSHLQRL